MRYKNAAQRLVKKLVKAEETASAWRKKEEIHVIHRPVVASRPRVEIETSPTCYRNGKPIRYQVIRQFVADPSHVAFAKELAYSFHSPFAYVIQTERSVNG
jgi:hypothetical protein